MWAFIYYYNREREKVDTITDTMEKPNEYWKTFTTVNNIENK